MVGRAAPFDLAKLEEEADDDTPDVATLAGWLKENIDDAKVPAAAATMTSAGVSDVCILRKRFPTVEWLCSWGCAWAFVLSLDSGMSCGVPVGSVLYTESALKDIPVPYGSEVQRKVESCSLCVTGFRDLRNVRNVLSTYSISVLRFWYRINIFSRWFYSFVHLVAVRGHFVNGK